MTAEVTQLPHIEVVHRVLELPVIERAIAKSAATYLRVKDCHQLVHWVLTTAETSLSSATKQAVPIAAPIAKKLENPIHFVDHTLCLGLDKIKEKVPIVEKEPEQILENAYILALQAVQPAVSSISLTNDLIVTQALNLRDISWNKANQILGTQYGNAAVRGLDNTAVVVDNLIDKYFPATGDEESIGKMADAKEATSKASSESTPHLEVIERVKSIPVIHSAIAKTESTYSYLKDSHHLVNWALSQAEAGLQYATATAAPITAPLAKKFEGQINAVDQKLCEGLNIVEQKMPIMTKPPQQIYDAAKAVMSSSLQPTIDKLNVAKESASQQASTLKEISITKANELLNTQYGNMAVQGVDNTSVLINGLLDQYFPPVEGEENVPAPVSADENKVLHTVQTMGQLSTKTASRVYHSVAAQLKTVKKEDVAAYMSSVISILHLTSFLSLIATQTECKAAQSPVDEKKGKN